MTESENQSHDVSGSNVRKGFRRNAKIMAVIAAIVAAAVVIYILALPSINDHVLNDPISGLQIDSTKPPPSDPPYMILFDFSSFSRNVSWSDIRLELTDGVNSIIWYPSADGLSGGTPISYCCGADSLGNMTVTCYVIDCLGDGTPSFGDAINLTATEDATFSATQNYTLRVSYIPTGGRVCTITFNGVPLTISKD